MFYGCTILWSFKMKHLIELNTTEATYIDFSAALREVIAVNNLISEI